MEVLLQTYYILLPIITTSLLGWVGVLLNTQRKAAKLRDEEANRTRKANSRGIMLVLRYMLKRYHAEYVVQGKITYNQYKDWIDLYSAYTALGGNSIATDWNDDVEKMEKCDSISEMSIFEMMLRNNASKVE